MFVFELVRVEVPKNIIHFCRGNHARPFWVYLFESQRYLFELVVAVQQLQKLSCLHRLPFNIPLQPVLMDIASVASHILKLVL